jgi:hypothetical protein
MNIQTGEIRPWDQLTEDEKKSGDWLKLPTRPQASEASVVRAFMAGVPIVTAHGLPVDARPEAKRRAAAAERAAREILGPPQGIVEAEAMDGEARRALLGLVTPTLS